MKKTLILTVAILGWVACQSAFAQSPVVTGFTGGGGPFSSFYGTLLPSGDTVGYRFTADANITITHLGVHDDGRTTAGQDGTLDSSHQVGLWRNSDQMLLCDVVADSSGLHVGEWFYAPCSSSVALTANEEYTLGAVYASDDNDTYFSGPSSISTDMISNTAGVEPGAIDLGFIYPPVTSTNLARIGPNALYVPEPTSLTLCGLGICLLLWRRRS